MDRRHALCLLGPLTAACATIEPASVEDRTLAYGCNDVVVVGRLRNGAFDPIKDDGDILGHGVVHAAIQVRRVVKGPKLPTTIPVNYVAHTNMREDRDFMLVLTREEGGNFAVKAGQLMFLRPLLARQCELSPAG